MPAVVPLVGAPVELPELELVDVPASVSLPLEPLEVSLLAPVVSVVARDEPESEVMPLESAEEETDVLVSLDVVGPLDVESVIAVVVPLVVDEVESTVPVCDDELSGIAVAPPSPQPMLTQSATSKDQACRIG